MRNSKGEVKNKEEALARLKSSKGKMKVETVALSEKIEAQSKLSKRRK